MLPVGEGSERAQCHLLCCHPTFHHFPCFPQVGCALSGADLQVGGFVYVLGPCGSLQWTLLWSWEVFLLPTPHRCFYSLGFWVFSFLLWSPGFCGLSRYPVVPPGLSVLECGTAHVVHQLLPCPCQSTSHRLAVCPFCPSYCVVECFFNSLVDGLPCKCFSGSSGYSLFLNWFLSFWLWKEVKHIYLHLHLGRNPHLFIPAMVL